MPLSLSFVAANGTLLANHSEGGFTFGPSESFSIHNNRVLGDMSDGAHIPIVGAVTTDTYTLTLSMHMLTEAGAAGVTICGDAPYLNGYLVRMYQDDLSIWRTTGGTPVLLDTAVIAGISPASDLSDIDIHVSPTDIDVDYGGVATLTTTDTAHARSGGVGIYYGAAVTTTTGYQINSIDVDNLLTEVVISNIDTDNDIKPGQTGVVITLADGTETVPTTVSTWYALLKTEVLSEGLTEVSWNNGAPIIDVPIDINLPYDAPYDLVVGYTI